MRPLTYLEKLTDPRWQKLRLKIMERDKWICCFCGDTQSTFNVHHLKYHGEPWEAPESELITICEDCHYLISGYKIDIIRQNFLCKKITINARNKMVFTFYDDRLIVSKKVDSKKLEYVVEFSVSDTKTLVQFIINSWLETGDEDLLIDAKFKTDSRWLRDLRTPTNGKNLS